MGNRQVIITESAFTAMPNVVKRNPNTVEFIAILQAANEKNRNGRYYPKSVLEEALNAPYVQERLRTNTFYGEAGHPMDTSMQRQLTIDQRNIACMVKEFWWEGNLLKAKIETADTAIGRDMKGLIEQGSRVAFSLRAQGNVHQDQQLNATVVDRPIQIVSYDWVVNPSHEQAFLQKISEETHESFFKVNREEIKNRPLVLIESTTLFENGSMVDVNSTVIRETIDYTKSYGKRVKLFNEAYIYSEDDKLTISPDKRYALLESEDCTKKVILEDYVTKDIRHKIVNLGKDGE